MKCYYHEGVDAVALCQACHRGLCRDCAVDVGFTTSCRDRCESEVLSHVALFEQGQKAYGANSLGYKATGMFLFATAAGSFGAGILCFLDPEQFGSGVLMTGIGVVTFFFGMTYYKAGVNLKMKRSPETGSTE